MVEDNYLLMKPFMRWNIRYILLGLISIIITVVEILLGLRLILKLFSANQNAAFVSWIYGTTEPLLAPFEGMFPTAVEQGFVLEFSTLFAILIYALVGWLLAELIDFIAEAASDDAARDRERRHGRDDNI